MSRGRKTARGSEPCGVCAGRTQEGRGSVAGSQAGPQASVLRPVPAPALSFCLLAGIRASGVAPAPSVAMRCTGAEGRAQCVWILCPAGHLQGTHCPRRELVGLLRARGS